MLCLFVVDENLYVEVSRNGMTWTVRYSSACFISLLTKKASIIAYSTHGRLSRSYLGRYVVYKKASDLEKATRSCVWLQLQHLVVYDVMYLRNTFWKALPLSRKKARPGIAD